MSKFPDINITIQDFTKTPPSLPKGIIATLGFTERGVLNTPTLVRSKEEFRKAFGTVKGAEAFSYFPLYCERMLDRGVPLLVTRIAVSNDYQSGLYNSTKATKNYLYTNASLSVEAANIGVWGNRLRVRVTEPKSGKLNFKDVHVRLLGEESMNYIVRDFATQASSAQIADFNEKSHLLKINGRTGVLLDIAEFALSGGIDDYSNPTIGAYFNDQEGQGLRTFDSINNIGLLCIPDAQVGDDVINFESVLSAYIDKKKLECYYTPNLGFLGLSNTPEAYYHFIKGTATWIEREPIKNRRFRYILGSLKIRHPLTNEPIFINAAADWAACRSLTINKFGEWFSEGNSERGFIPNVLGLEYSYRDSLYKDALAEQGANMVMQDKERVFCITNNNAWREDTQLKFANVSACLDYVVENLKTIMFTEIGNPNDIPTWLSLFNKSSAFLDTLKNARGIYEYVYNGDQFVSKIQDCVVNNLNEVTGGKYKVHLRIKFIAALNYVDVVLTMDGLNISYEII